MEIIKNPPKPQPWRQRLVDMDVDDRFYIEVGVSQTVSSTASRLKIEYPDRHWSVVKNRDEKTGILTHCTVTRIS